MQVVQVPLAFAELAGRTDPLMIAAPTDGAPLRAEDRVLLRDLDGEHHLARVRSTWLGDDGSARCAVQRLSRVPDDLLAEHLAAPSRSTDVPGHRRVEVDDVVDLLGELRLTDWGRSLGDERRDERRAR